ncbi:MAG TPA: CDP-alcohol phosphatidyltransferase family protein [Steroidobacteraceae bacterium]|nr:CDP-alcohol phosphatidyltransferase family protein [Steroidobacteraceae bacterium]
MPQSPGSPTAVAGHVVGQSGLRIWSLTSGERLRRQLRRAGAAADADAQRVVLLRADWVYDDPFVRGLVARAAPCGMWRDETCVALVVPPQRLAEAGQLLAAGRAPPDLPRVAPQEIAGSYNDKLRKRETPFLLPLTAEQLPAIEKRVFAGSYKGVTDFVTLSWPKAVSAVTRVCAALRLTPNMVTCASLLLTILATWLFWHGRYGSGLLAAWLMAFLDSVDGKLARVTLTYTKFGDLFDHLIDLIHPPFWWWAWIVGLPAAGRPLPWAGIALAVIVAGYLLQRLEEGLFMSMFGMDMHVWRRFDSRFRLVTARRNPNLAILTVATLAGRPDTGIAIVAVWVAVCLLVHAVRIAQAGLARRAGPLTSWLA